MCIFQLPTLCFPDAWRVPLCEMHSVCKGHVLVPSVWVDTVQCEKKPEGAFSLHATMEGKV